MHLRFLHSEEGFNQAKEVKADGCIHDEIHLDIK
jgi:hypothetical protein